MGWIRDMVKSWLQIEPAVSQGVAILEPMAFENEVLQNRLWYRGNPSELQQFYEQTDDMIGNTAFWAARGTTGIAFRKIHSGLPALIVDTLSDIVCNDLLSVCVSDNERQRVWNLTAKENGFEKLLRLAVRTALSEGDGAFKISVDTDVSDMPIIEFFGADRVEYRYKRGRLNKVIFITEIYKGRQRYVLREVYCYGNVYYELLDEEGFLCDLDELEETAGLKEVSYDRRLLMAVPLMFDESSKEAGRGKSLFDGKIGVFDGLDEVISQWVDSLRDGRANTYIPIGLLPRNPNSGAVMKPNGFDNRYVQTAGDLTEGALNKIEVVQAEIKTGALMESYATFLDLCLQGIIAPATLGIDLKKRDNAEAQREKEKATLYTRNKIIERLRVVIPQVVSAVLGVWELLTEEAAVDYDVTVNFGEYGSPSFDEQVKTVGEAVSMGVMSVKTAVEELYGDTWTDEDKEAEVLRLERRGDY